MSVYYVVYKGEEPVCVGERDEIAKKLGISEASVQWLSTPTAKKRADAPGSTKMFAEKVQLG